MNIQARAFPIIFAVGLSLATAIDAAQPPERSVSPSGQFIIYGSDPALRGSISDLAEKTKSNLLSTLQQRDNWQIAVVINLETPQANLPEVSATTLRLGQTGAGLKLQLDLLISSVSDRSAIQRELCRAILLEMIYRKKSSLASGTAYIEPPQWLIEGLLANSPTAEHAGLIETLLFANNVTSLDDFLHQRPELLDTAGKLLYRAHSFALVQLLLELPDGRAHLCRYIENLSAASNDPMSDVRSAFPQLTRANADDFWKSKLSRLSASESQQLLTFAQTEAKLTELHPDRLNDFCRRKPNQAEQVALQKLNQDLLLLAAHANPVLRPLIQQYQQIALQLANGRNHDAATRLASLNSSRTKLSARMNDIDDYLNWFEAAKLETSSGLFENYLKAADDTSVSTSRRKDAISVYLDAMEQEF